MRALMALWLLFVLKNSVKLEEGTYLGERNFSALKVVLKDYNLEDHFESFRVSPKYPGEFKHKLEEFTKRISSIPDAKEKTA